MAQKGTETEEHGNSVEVHPISSQIAIPHVPEGGRSHQYTYGFVLLQGQGNL